MFSFFETSVFSGRPIEFLLFQCGVRTWRYCNRAVTINFGGYDYKPLSEYRRSSVGIKQFTEDASMTLNLRGDLELLQLYVSTPPSETMSVTIYQVHEDDVDQEPITLFMGNLSTCAWIDDLATAELIFNAVDNALSQPGLRRSFQYTCPYTLYSDRGCRVNRLAYKDIGVVQSISGRTVTMSSLSRPDDWYAGGYMVWTTSEGAVEKRWIYASVGSSLQLHITSIGLDVGDTVEMYAGCDHSIGTCNTKFNNVDRYGGFPLIPKTNPFNGDNPF